jgi:D-3-phosphoglycerate dehydrogenase
VGTIAKLGFTNHEDFTSSKEQIEAKIQDYQGIVIRSRFKIDKEFLDKATNLQFIAQWVRVWYRLWYAL